MGNCLNRGSTSMVWAEDDRDEWEWVSPEKIIAEREELKIVISKKQLEQLLGKGETAADQVLAGLLVDAGNRGGSEMLRQRSWRPRLQSIPEVN
nr:DUF4228 domain protein [Ipomoea batatas]GMC83722.1 DUF4228 domain protein [Ipomoea batatas]GMC89826.1 DUF4228 domain protein [Ipomoea batatas]